MSEIWAGLAPHIVTISIMLLVMGGMMVVHRLWPKEHAQSVPPLDILAQRFARGEIDRQDYEERRRVLASRALGRRADPAHLVDG